MYGGGMVEVMEVGMIVSKWIVKVFEEENFLFF